MDFAWPRLAITIDEETATQTAQRRQRNVERDALLRHQPEALAVFRDERETLRKSFARIPRNQWLAVQFDRSPGSRTPEPHQVQQQLGTSRTHETADPQHFTGPGFEFDAVERKCAVPRRFHVDTAQRKQRAAGRGLPARVVVLDADDRPSCG